MRYISVITLKKELPMQKISTQLIKNENNVGKTRGPRQATVNFLKQFARVYTCQALTTPKLSGFVAN